MVFVTLVCCPAAAFFKLSPLLPAFLERSASCLSWSPHARAGIFVVQVRRMFATFGHHVVALHRSQVGGLTLEGLDEGEWRPIR
eukprot:1160691-Pelagomonas_calceolata.AAC.7